MKKKIYLIGCRAVGKTSIGKHLAQKLGYSFEDTDEVITGAGRTTVSEIVANDGWAKFREVEKEVLMEVAACKETVVATGGGAIVHEKCWKELQKNGVVVWLKADFEVLCGRIRNDTRSESQRPSLTGNDVCVELKNLLAERTPLYRKTADITVDSTILSVHTVVEEIINQLEGYLKIG